jgi:MFS family permease
MQSRAVTKTRIPKGIWALGAVSLLMDTSSELIHSLLPIFLVSVLGTSVLSVGFIEGTAEATALLVKIFSGAVSDFIGKRKLLTVLGYGIAAATKPLFPLADSTATVFAARFVDRVGKGIRGAPRDALIAELAPPEIRGASFGLRQSLDTVGAFAGPLLAVACLVVLADDLRTVLWVATLPAIAAVLVLIAAVHEPSRRSASAGHEFRSPIHVSDLLGIGANYWWLVAIAAILTLGRFSEAFLILRAENIGLAVRLVPMVLVVMNVAYALSSYPAGVLSDRLDRGAVLALGCAVMIGSQVILGFAQSAWLVTAGVVLWGLHLGLTQSILAAMVADAAPARLRGTAFGVLSFASGIAVLLANVMAGALWDRYGPSVTFFGGAAFTSLGLSVLLWYRRGGTDRSRHGG